MQIEKLFIGIQPLLLGAKIGQEGTRRQNFGGKRLAYAKAEPAYLRILVQNMRLAADPRGDGQHGRGPADHDIGLEAQGAPGKAYGQAQK